MNVLLVWPKFASFSFWNFQAVCKLSGVKYMTPPLGLLTVAALLPEEWNLRVVDENVEPMKDSDLDWADRVFVSAKIVHRKRAFECIGRAKEAGLPVAVGGPDPTLNPERYRDAGADYLVLDEGEITIPMLLEDLEKGASCGTYRTEELADMTKSPVPRFDLINHRDYLYVGIQFSRGCPYRCEFCNVIDLFDNKYRKKNIEQVIAEVQALYDLGYRGQLDFFDDNLVGHFHDAKPLLRALRDWGKAHGFPFQHSTSVTVNVAKDPELLSLLREARFKFLLVGIETPDEESLKQTAKGHNTGFSITEAVEKIYREAGATVHSGFLLGLDGEPSNIGDKVVECIDSASIPWVMAGVVYPLPGTQLAKRLEREGRLFESAKGTHDDKVRDQISAGLQFVTERPPLEVLDDLIRITEHSFDPKKYFARCADVAVQLNTLPNLVPGWRIFFRNARTFMRLCFKMTTDGRTRGPFLKALFKVLRRNSKGLESLATLSVLYVHFQSMLPYVYEQLAMQRAEIEADGPEEFLRRRLGLPAPANDDDVDQIVPRPLPASVPGAAVPTSA